MKISLYLVILFLTPCNINPNKISKILIKYVDYNTETIYKINCNNFEKQFGSSIHSRLITNIAKIRRFQDLEKSLKPNRNKYFPDVRAKIIIYYSNGSNDTLCIDGGNAADLNGKPMIISENFVAFINKIE